MQEAKCTGFFKIFSCQAAKAQLPKWTTVLYRWSRQLNCAMIFRNLKTQSNVLMETFSYCFAVYFVRLCWSHRERSMQCVGPMGRWSDHIHLCYVRNIFKNQFCVTQRVRVKRSWGALLSIVWMTVGVFISLRHWLMTLPSPQPRLSRVQDWMLAPGPLAAVVCCWLSNWRTGCGGLVMLYNGLSRLQWPLV